MRLLSLSRFEKTKKNRSRRRNAASRNLVLFRVARIEIALLSKSSRPTPPPFAPSEPTSNKTPKSFDSNRIEVSKSNRIESFERTNERMRAVPSARRVYFANRTPKFALSGGGRRRDASARGRRFVGSVALQKRHNFIFRDLRVVRRAHLLDGVRNAHQNRAFYSLANPFEKVKVHRIPLISPTCLADPLFSVSPPRNLRKFGCLARRLSENLARSASGKTAFTRVFVSAFRATFSFFSSTAATLAKISLGVQTAFESSSNFGWILTIEQNFLDLTTGLADKNQGKGASSVRTPVDFACLCFLNRF